MFKPMLARYIYGYASEYSPDMDESISENFKVLDI